MRFLVIAATLLITIPLLAQPTLAVDIKGDVTGTAQTDIVCKVTAGDVDVKSGTLVVLAPSNFSVDPQAIVLPGIPAKQTITRISRLKANDAKQPTAENNAIVELSASTTSAAAMVVGSKPAHFKYVNDCLDVGWYLF